MRVGDKNIASHCKDIAEFLQLDEPQRYTGGASTAELLMIGKWRNEATALKYVAQDVSTKRALSNLATGVPMSRGGSTTRKRKRRRRQQHQQ